MITCFNDPARDGIIGTPQSSMARGTKGEPLWSLAENKECWQPAYSGSVQKWCRRHDKHILLWLSRKIFRRWPKAQIIKIGFPYRKNDDLTSSPSLLSGSGSCRTSIWSTDGVKQNIPCLKYIDSSIQNLQALQTTIFLSTSFFSDRGMIGEKRITYPCGYWQR